MIVLNADQSMLLLITKNWTHKDVDRFPKEDNMDYIQRVCNYRCFGSQYLHKADVYSIYSSLCEKLLTVRELLMALEYVTPSSHVWTMTKIEALIHALSMVRCIAEDGTELIKFDKSLIKDVSL